MRAWLRGFLCVCALGWAFPLRADARSEALWYVRVLNRDNRKDFCLPASLTVAQSLDIVKRYLKDSGRDSVTEADVILALSAAYPCPPLPAGGGSPASGGPGSSPPAGPKGDLNRWSGAAPRRSTITPVFSQLVRFPLPEGFQEAFEDARGDSYLLEFTRPGEDVNHWTQRITLTGARNLALKRPEMTPKDFAQTRVGLFHRSCGGGFGSRGIFDGKAGPWDAFAALESCGHAGDAGAGGLPGASHRETTLLVVLKGEKDFYTLQWAEKGPPEDSAKPLNKALWFGRLRALCPILLCPRVPGEKPPYPSCTGAAPAQAAPSRLGGTEAETAL